MINFKEMQDFEVIKEIKKDFYRYRNGIVADSLKKLYPPKTIIFGLIVPQFLELSIKYSKDINLGLQLWNDKNCRESRLLSLYIIPPSELDKKTAMEMIRNVNSSEIAEFLAFRILRNLNKAREVLQEIERENITEPLPSYCISMFKKNLLSQ